MATIITGGKSYAVIGNNVTIRNGSVIVDGKVIEGIELKSPVTLKVEGDPLNVKSDGNIAVFGNVAGNAEAGGNIECECVGGYVEAGGSVNSGDVTGYVNANGSVTCGNIGGHVKANGSVNMTK